MAFEDVTREQRNQLPFRMLGLRWLRWRRPERLRFEAQRRAGQGNLAAYLAAVRFTGADDQPWAAHALEALYFSSFPVYDWLWIHHCKDLEQAAASLILAAEKARSSTYASALVPALPVGENGLVLVDALMWWCVMEQHIWLAKALLERVPMPDQKRWLDWCCYAISGNKFQMLLRLLKWGRSQIHDWQALKDKALVWRQLEIFELLEILEQGRSDLSLMREIEDLVPAPALRIVR